MGGMVNVLETWFDDWPAATRGFDLLICHQRSSPLDDRRWLYFYTILIDLRLSPEELLGRMKKTTIKEIRRARDRDRLATTFIDAPTPADIDEFTARVDSIPKIQGQARIDRDRLRKLNRAGFLNISKIRAEDGTELIWRCNFAYKAQNRIQPLFMTSLQYVATDPATVNLLGRANRFLFYSEMLHFKDKGYLIYDFNGWYAGLEDAKRLQINQFKEGFGGRIVHGYDCEEPLSWRGRLYLLLRSMKQRLLQPHLVREIERRRRKAPRLPEDAEP